MRIISYNVNGIRSAINKGFIEWLKANPADIICLQEVKANESDVNLDAIKDLGFKVYWCSAQKKGYSGVAVLSKYEASQICIGSGKEMSDAEGRIIRIDIGDISIINAYFPSGTTGEIRQNYKYQWLEEFKEFIESLKTERKHLIVCGDYNICHQAIDIHDPNGNKNSSGFLPDERAWMDRWFDAGFIDTFRMINPHPHQYSWWSYRANARANNKGWRIDYISVSTSLKPYIKDAAIFPKIVHSDHCPVYLELDFSSKDYKNMTVI